MRRLLCWLGIHDSVQDYPNVRLRCKRCTAYGYYINLTDIPAGGDYVWKR